MLEIDLPSDWGKTELTVYSQDKRETAVVKQDSVTFWDGDKLMCEVSLAD